MANNCVMRRTTLWSSCILRGWWI